MKTTAELLTELFTLSQSIQDRKIADVEFNHYGFMRYFTVKLTEPQTIVEMYVTAGSTELVREMTEQVEILKSIAEHGMGAIPGIEEKQAEILLKKRAQFEQLRKELAA